MCFGFLVSCCHVHKISNDKKEKQRSEQMNISLNHTNRRSELLYILQRTRKAERKRAREKHDIKWTTSTHVNIWVESFFFITVAFRSFVAGEHLIDVTGNVGVYGMFRLLFFSLSFFFLFVCLFLFLFLMYSILVEGCRHFAWKRCAVIFIQIFENAYEILFGVPTTRYYIVDREKSKMRGKKLK